MKKLFCLLTAVTIVFISSEPTVIFLKDNEKFVEQKEKFYRLDSFKNLIKAVNFYDNHDFEEISSLENDWTFNQLINSEAEKYYYELFNNHQGILDSLKSTLKEEMMIQNFNVIYKNYSPNDQEFKTQSYSKTITNNHNFSVKVKESVSYRSNFNFSYLNTKITAEINSEQGWEHKKTLSETINNPSQSFIVSPNHIGKANYTIIQGTYYNEGVIRFPVNQYYQIFYPVIKKNNQGKIEYSSSSVQFNTEEFKTILKLNDLKNGLGENQIYQFEKDYPEYSFFSTYDNKYYVNLPISWYSQGGKFNVIFNEEQLVI